MFASGLGLAIWVAGSVTDGVRIEVGAPLWNSDCAAHAETCVADLPVVVTNLKDRAVTVEGFDFVDPPWYAYQRGRVFVVAPRIVEPGCALHHQLNGIKDTEWTRVVRAVVRFAPGRRPKRIDSQPFVLTNVSREAAKQACKRDRGDWRASYFGRPYCVARAPDGGKTCRDGNECKGVCLADGHERVGPPEGPFRRQKWRLVGQCSEFVSGRSCYAYIWKGASSEPPVYSAPPAPMICSD